MVFFKQSITLISYIQINFNQMFRVINFSDFFANFNAEISVFKALVTWLYHHLLIICLVNCERRKVFPRNFKIWICKSRGLCLGTFCLCFFKALGNFFFLKKSCSVITRHFCIYKMSVKDPKLSGLNFDEQGLYMGVLRFSFLHSKRV